MAKIIDFITATSIADNDFLAMADTAGNTRKVEKSTLAPLVNDLTTGGIDKYLSAEQGKVVKGLIDTNTTDINALKDEVNKTSLTNIEIGASPITSLTGMLDGFVDTLIFKGKTKYKTSGGTYTDTYATGVTIESTGEVEGKMIMTSLKPDNSVGDTLNATVTKPLRALGTVKDMYNVTNKTITRYIGQMKFNGASTEAWVLGTPPLSTNTLQFKIPIADGKIGLISTDVNIMCDKFVSDTSANNISNDAEGIAFDNNGYVLVRILKSKLATQDVAGFKLWLASVNVTIVYQLINSITETVKKVPTLQTFKDGYLQLQNAIVPVVNFNYSVELASIVSEHTRVIDDLEDVVVENSDKIGVLTTDLSDIVQDVSDLNSNKANKEGTLIYQNIIDGTMDLNTLNTTGFYQIGDAVNIVNAPPNSSWSVLEVLKTSAYIRQIVSSINNIHYIRVKSDTTWGAWKLIGVQEETNLILSNGWVNNIGDVRVGKIGKQVTINAVLSGGTTLQNSIFATLPYGFRPSVTRYFVVTVYNESFVASNVDIQVDTNGDIKFVGIPSGNTRLVCNINFTI